MSEQTKLLLTPAEAAETLSISQRTLWTMTKKGQVACVRLGRAVRYCPRDLEELIKSQRNQNNGEYHETAERPKSHPICRG